MKNTFEGATPPPQESKEAKEKIGNKMLDNLASGFGGHSQLPDDVVGMAIMGQFNNGQLMYASVEDGVALVKEVANTIHERWEDVEDAPTLNEIFNKIVEGIKKQAESWKEDSRLQEFIDAVSNTK